MTADQIINLVLVVSVFGLVLSIWTIGVLLWGGKRLQQEKHIHQRLGLDEQKQSDGRVLHLWHDGEDVTTTVPQGGGSRGVIARMGYEARRAGWKINGLVVLALMVGVAMLIVGVALVITGNIALALVLGVGWALAFRMYEQHRIGKRDALFERQFVDALELASRSLRAGHPLMGAFQLVADEMSAPVNKIFGEICQQHAMGADVDQVLRDAAERTTSVDMKLFATSVAIQIRSGGNLAELMDRLAQVIRDRIRLSRRVRILTAQTQMSKRVLLVLPFLVFILFTVLNPNYMEPFYTTGAGRLMLAIAVLMLAAGTWVMNRMAVLRY